MSRVVLASLAAITLTTSAAVTTATAAIQPNQAPVCLIRYVELPSTAGYLYRLPVNEVAEDPEGKPVRLVSFTNNSIWWDGTAHIDLNGTPKRRTDDTFVFQRSNPLTGLATQYFSIVVSDGKARTTCDLDIDTFRSPGLG